MTGIVNPIEPLTSLLRPVMPGVYIRAMVYDPTYADESYNAYVGQRVVPAVGSVVQDTNGTPMWVIAIDPVTYIPTYNAMSLGQNDDNVVSMLDYGNSVLRLYLDTRALPYPATPDAKCIFLGKSPRFYTLCRYPGTPQESIISQYFDSTGTLTSANIPLIALDNTNSSWYMPRCNISTVLLDNEEIRVRVYDEGGAEVYSALLFAKESSVINEDVMYTPTIVGMTVTGTQKLANGTFFLYERQDFDSLGLSVSLVYSDGSTLSTPIDGIKCFLYGQSDFISSFAGLTQNLVVKYFRTSTENISPGIADPTGSMISTTIPVTVVPNGLNTTAKISVLPYYNGGLSQYSVKYWIYFGDGSSHIDISGYVTIPPGTLVLNSASYGTPQNFVISVDMSQVEPTVYLTATTYAQNEQITFNPPTTLVKYSISDGSNSQYTYGLDNSTSRRPIIHYDSALNQYFIPTGIFANQGAFINSFYIAANPPFDPSVMTTPPTPDGFVIRDLTTGAMIVAGEIPVTSYSLPFTIIESLAGTHNNGTLVVEFLVTISSKTYTLFGVPVEVISGTYI